MGFFLILQLLVTLPVILKLFNLTEKRTADYGRMWKTLNPVLARNQIFTNQNSKLQEPGKRSNTRMNSMIIYRQK